MGKRAADLLMLSSLHIVFSAPVRFVVAALIKLTLEWHHQVNTFLTGFDVINPSYDRKQLRSPRCYNVAEGGPGVVGS
jgi:hypothetical protein